MMRILSVKERVAFYKPTVYKTRVETMLDYCKAHHTQRGTHKSFFGQFFVAIKRERGFTASFFRVKLQLALVLERNAKKSPVW